MILASVRITLTPLLNGLLSHMFFSFSVYGLVFCCLYSNKLIIYISLSFSLTARSTFVYELLYEEKKSLI